jgi:hypothetical protein
MKTKINFYDRCFRRHGKHGHQVGSCCGIDGKEAQTVEFSDGSADIDLFTEHCMHMVMSTGTGKVRILWLQESRAIRPYVYEFIEKNYEEYLDKGRLDAIYTFDESLCKLDSRFRHYVGNGFLIKKADEYEKTKLVSMIVSTKNLCPEHKERLRVLEKYKDSVDVFGRGHNPIKYKEEGLCSYMFSFAMENSRTDSYMSEKVFDCFATATIPIYLGTSKIIEHFNPGGILFLTPDFDLSLLNRSLYDTMLPAAIDNLNRVKEMEIPIDYYFKEFFQC